jgi:aminomethyltransferase
MLNRTPFYDIHRKAGAKLVEFGGWEMPVQYEGIRKEHKAVRSGVGLFDVSHMGEIFINGPQAFDLIQFVTVNDVAILTPGRAQYSVMCYEDGGIVDDLIVYMLAEQSYMLVVNAANIEKDFKWIGQHNDFDAELKDFSLEMCLLAVQGPKSTDVLQKLTDVDLSDIKFYTFEKGNFIGFDDIIISATGYTGEKGFELYFNKNEVDALKIWQAVIEAGREFDMQPCGLGARDTLRLEMGYALYGNDISRETNPLEARLGWLTKLDKNEFVGKRALQKIKEEGLTRILTGFTLEDKRAIPRHGYAIEDGRGRQIGQVTSGTRSFTLNKNIGMGYLPLSHAKQGKNIYIHIREKAAEAKVVKPPFLKKN